MDWRGKYLVKRIDRPAHLWTGLDTVCRMASTGGLNKNRYLVVENHAGPICHMCASIWKRSYIASAHRAPNLGIMTEGEQAGGHRQQGALHQDAGKSSTGHAVDGSAAMPPPSEEAAIIGPTG